MSGESAVEENVQGEEQDLEDKILSGELKWVSRTFKSELAVETCCNNNNSEIDTFSDRNSSTGSDLSEYEIHTLLVETRSRDLDREVYQDTDSDRYLVPSERVFDNAADDLET